MPALIVASQGACASLPCSLGAMAAGRHAPGCISTAASPPPSRRRASWPTRSWSRPPSIPAGVTACGGAGAFDQCRVPAAQDAGRAERERWMPAVSSPTRCALPTPVPGLARSVDVKDQLPPGLSLENITAEGGVCAGPLCQFGNLPVDSTRTVTVVARVSSAAPAGVITNTAGRLQSRTRRSSPRL